MELPPSRGCPVLLTFPDTIWAMTKIVQDTPLLFSASIILECFAFFLVLLICDAFLKFVKSSGWVSNSSVGSTVCQPWASQLVF